MAIFVLRLYKVNTDYYKYEPKNSSDNSSMVDKQNKSKNSKDNNSTADKQESIEDIVINSIPNAKFVEVKTSGDGPEYDYDYVFECDDYTFHVYNDYKRDPLFGIDGVTVYSSYYRDITTDRISVIYNNILKDQIDNAVSMANLDSGTIFEMDDEKFEFVIASYNDLDKIEKLYNDVFNMYIKYGYQASIAPIKEKLVFNISRVYRSEIPRRLVSLNNELIIGTTPNVHDSITEVKYKYVEDIKNGNIIDGTIDQSIISSHPLSEIKRVVVNNCNGSKCEYDYPGFKYDSIIGKYCTESIFDSLEKSLSIYHLVYPSDKNKYNISTQLIRPGDIYNKNGLYYNIDYDNYQFKVLFKQKDSVIDYHERYGREMVIVDDIFKFFAIKITNIDYQNGIIYVEKK